MAENKYSGRLREVLGRASNTQEPEPDLLDVRRSVANEQYPPTQPALDPEAAAIHDIVMAVQPLDGEARARVLQYIGLRFPTHKFQD